MTVTADIIAYLDSWAPPSLAASWDPIGLQIGDTKQDVKTVFVALEVTRTLCEMLSKNPVDLVVTHHPFFFKPLKSVTFGSDYDQVLSLFLGKRIQLFSMHTNLDSAQGGVADTLVKSFGLNISSMKPTRDGYGRIVTLSSPVSLSDLSGRTTGRLAGFTEDRPVSTLIFCGGSGKSLCPELITEEADCLITGEVGYHDEVWADFHHKSLFLLGHKESEDLICPVIARHLEAEFPGLSIQF